MFICNKKMFALKTLFFVTVMNAATSYSMENKDNYDIRNYFTSNPNIKPKQYNKSLESSNNFSGFQQNKQLENNSYMGNINYNIISNNTNNYSKQNATLEENNSYQTNSSFYIGKQKVEVKNIEDMVESQLKLLQNINSCFDNIKEILKNHFQNNNKFLLSKKNELKDIKEFNNFVKDNKGKVNVEEITKITILSSNTSFVQHLINDITKGFSQEKTKKIALCSLPAIKSRITQLISYFQENKYDIVADFLSEIENINKSIYG